MTTKNAGHVSEPFGILGVALTMVLAFSTFVQGQGITGASNGQPVIATGATTATSDGSYWDAKQFTGSDICAQISAAWTAALKTGVTSATIDARGITGPQNCASPGPFPHGAAGKLLLGNTQITTKVTWNVPGRVIVQGLGITASAPRNPQYTVNTTITAGSTAADPVIQLGTSNVASFDAQVRDLTVDGFGLVTTGILNNSSQEGTLVENVNIQNATSYGLLLQPTGSNCSGLTSPCTPANSGPYRNISVQYNSNCAACGTSTVGVAVLASSTQHYVIRGIEGLTVSGSGTSGQAIGSCMEVIGTPVRIADSHAEFCTTGIQIGSAGGALTPNVQVQNVSSNSFTSGWDITISNASNILLAGILGNGPTVLADNVTGNQITAAAQQPYYLGFYLLGDSSGSSPAVISTNATVSSGPYSPNLEWVAPGGLDVLSALQKPAGSFKIDHPLDPTHKFLFHSFVESPDMMNVYNGTVTTDEHGFATVNLPPYFEALNKDFRYQVTAIGSFAQATVAKEIDNNQFTIRTSRPRVKVSWQVTGVRHDQYAEEHRIEVEADKPPCGMPCKVHDRFSASQP